MQAMNVAGKACVGVMAVLKVCLKPKLGFSRVRDNYSTISLEDSSIGSKESNLQVMKQWSVFLSVRPANIFHMFPCVGENSIRNGLYVINHSLDCHQPALAPNCWLSEGTELLHFLPWACYLSALGIPFLNCSAKRPLLSKQ